MKFKKKIIQNYKEKKKDEVSPFQPLETALAEGAFPRYQWESFHEWTNRLEKSNLLEINYTELRELITLYYQQRFSQNENSPIFEEKINDFLLKLS
ncbi:MAG: hypothetical protein HQK84_07500 [Nitrospinae bacterium]|nr:hypothetical protein [Nitrospinota bacterium]